MKKNSRFQSVSLDDLEQVSGGLSCAKAEVVATTYIGLASWYVSLGLSQQALAAAQTSVQALITCTPA